MRRVAVGAALMCLVAWAMEKRAANLERTVEAPLWYLASGGSKRPREGCEDALTATAEAFA